MHAKTLQLGPGSKCLLFAGWRGFGRLWPQAVKHFGVQTCNPPQRACSHKGQNFC